MCNAHIIIYVMTPDPKEKSQTKSKKRVRDHGEVFTAEREVKAMCDLVKDETQRIDSRFLEPACGDGNFLAEILKCKLAVVRKKYGKRAADYEKNAVLAVSSVYGIDILADNVQACRARLEGIWEKEYEDVCKKPVPAKRLAPKDDVQEDFTAADVGAIVIHAKFGEGKIIKKLSNGKYITVAFAAGEKNFVFPDSFAVGFLRLKK